jgi:membrane-bound lytic murein transglycosylase A
MAKAAQRSPALLILVLVLAIAAAAVWLWQSRVLAPSSRVTLTPVSFIALPGWSTSDARAALAAFRRSCATFAKEPPTHALGGAGYAGAVADWEGVCAAAPGGNTSEDAARRYFETWFAPLSVAAGSDTDALFTGYYEPEIHGSRRRHGVYATPVYGAPDDLVSADLGLFRENLKGEHVTGRVLGHTFVPYFSRAQIDADGLARAPVLLYADDPVQVFFLHIQGSGRVRLDNGAFVRLAYAGQNGRPYTPVGRVLIEQGAVDRSQMSMQAIRSWMQTHADAARSVMESDQSFVFFKLTPLGDPALGSPGSEGVALTPEASIAVDEHLHALGAPFFVAANAPDPDPSKPERPLNRLFVAQDTGGAIKGAARADVFWGFGHNAESTAGRMKSTGQLFVLLPKPLAARIAPHTEFGAP